MKINVRCPMSNVQCRLNIEPAWIRIFRMFKMYIHKVLYVTLHKFGDVFRENLMPKMLSLLTIERQFQTKQGQCGVTLTDSLHNAKRLESLPRSNPNWRSNRQNQYCLAFGLEPEKWFMKFRSSVCIHNLCFCLLNLLSPYLEWVFVSTKPSTNRTWSQKKMKKAHKKKEQKK